MLICKKQLPDKNTYAIIKIGKGKFIIKFLLSVLRIYFRTVIYKV